MSPVGLALLAAVTLVAPRPIQPKVDAYPRIAAPDAAGKRINRALDALDGKVRAAIRQCRNSDESGPGDWERTVETPMRGPDFVSYLVTDSTYCGGAHPNVGHIAIVYDLATGAPVDWTTLLPPALVGKQELITGEDGVRVVTLASSRLSALYRAGYGKDLDPAIDAECRETVTSEGPVAMIAWLDAKQGGLALEFDLPHAVQACAETVIVPAALLQREGASARLLKAFATKQ